MLLKTKKKAKTEPVLPDVDALKAELQRENHKNRYNRTLRSTIYVLVVVAALAVLVATLWLPVFRIYGTTMSPTVSEGDVVVSVNGSSFERKDVVLLWYGNKLLVRRVIGMPGDKIYINDKGDVYVNDELLDEPYIVEKALGDCNISLPYQVPDGRYFVMCDNRYVSADSRSASVGCITKELIVGRVLLRIWPLSAFGGVSH